MTRFEDELREASSLPAVAWIFFKSAVWSMWDSARVRWAERRPTR